MTVMTVMTVQPASRPGGAWTDSAPGDVTRSARRWWALVAIAASVLVVGLDLTVLNLALPSMAVSLHASTGDLQWIVDSCSLVLAALILPAGLLGDRYGRKRVLVIALALFGAASLACAYATSTGALIAARAVLGTVISTSYSGGVAAAAAGLPAQAAAAVRSSAGAGVGVAHALGSASLAGTVRTAFVHGMDIMLWTCGGIALGCAILALLVLRRRVAAVAGNDLAAAGGEAGSIQAG